MNRWHDEWMEIIPQRFLSSLGAYFATDEYESEKKDGESAEEIRIRIGEPLYIQTSKGHSVRCHGENITENDIDNMMSLACRHSLYAYEEELRQGFLTIRGGHRIGICGETVTEDNKIIGMKNITSLNIRIAHEHRGCADDVLPYLMKNGQVVSTLIISPPGCGKTTLLRDIIRQLSDGDDARSGKNVSVVDERNEIAATYGRRRQNRLGCRTDVLTGCPKAAGMMLLIRSMSPQVLAVDELGGEEDCRALEAVVNCGASVIATIHGRNPEGISSKTGVSRLIDEKVFERYIVLSNHAKYGRAVCVLNEFGKEIGYVQADGLITAPVRDSRLGMGD